MFFLKTLHLVCVYGTETNLEPWEPFNSHFWSFFEKQIFSKMLMFSAAKELKKEICEGEAARRKTETRVVND